MDSEQILTFMQKTAARKGWKLTPDGELVGCLVEGFQTNFIRYGYFQCPCREGQGDGKLDRDILCPCEYAGEDISEYGRCFCGLFVNEEVHILGGASGSIPDRRDPGRYL